MQRRPKDSALSINVRGDSIGVGPRPQQCPDGFQPALRCRGEQRGPPDLRSALDHHLEHLGVRTHFQQELDDAKVLPGYGDMKCRASYSALALHSVRTDTWLRHRVQKYSHDLKSSFVHSRVQDGRDDLTVPVFRGDNGVGVGSGPKQIPRDCRITVLDGGMQRYVQIRLQQLTKRILARRITNAPGPWVFSRRADNASEKAGDPDRPLTYSGLIGVHERVLTQVRQIVTWKFRKSLRQNALHGDPRPTWHYIL